MATALHFVETVAGIAGVCLLVWLKYLQAKTASDRKDEKADIEALFSGRK